MSETTFDRGVALRERWRLFLDRGILAIFLVVGSLCIIALKLSSLHLLIRIGIPVSIILVYAALTLSRTRFRLRYDQTGDNCYYMGFIFTLVSLGVALYQIQPDVGAEAYGIAVVKDFGLALSTTIVGIICRVALTQLREDPHDIEEATRRELIEYSRALSGQVRASVSMMAEVRQETEDRLKNYVFEMSQVVKEHESRAVELKGATQKLSDSVKTLAADLTSTEIPTGKLRDATSGTLAAIALLTETLNRANSALGQIEGAASKVTASYDKNSTAGLDVAAHQAKVAESMAAGEVAIRQLSEATRLLNGALQMASSGARAYTAMADEVRGVTDALRTATRSIASSSSRLEAAEATLAAQLEVTEKAAKHLGQQIESMIAAQSRLGAAASTQTTAPAQ
ncbi:MAG: hypothetical protein KIT25_03825 [Enhydrobacter sp.]|nr:MAG: hypothetical protein KIT25_03825 [Enhydrobacter sp.]